MYVDYEKEIVYKKWAREILNLHEYQSYALLKADVLWKKNPLEWLLRTSFISVINSIDA